MGETDPGISMSFRETIWMLVVFDPGLFSLLPVVIFPKLFILRIHRTWRMKLIKDYEDNLQYFAACQNYYLDNLLHAINLRKEREYWTKMINEVEKDRIDVRNYEIIGAVLSVLLQVGVICATLAIK